MSGHLLVAVSPHGFGHTAQAAAVVNALRRRLPGLRVSLRTTVPARFLRTRFDGDFDLDPVADDFGMVMSSAIDVVPDDSAAAYVHWHRDWDDKVARVAEELARLAPDLVLANVPYLTLAAAARAGIPAVALSSLNWGDIFHHYCHGHAQARRIHDQIRAAYGSAAYFLQTEPSMPMADLANRRPVGPVAQVGRDRREEIRARLGLPPQTRLVLVNMGGIVMRLPMEEWPRLPSLRWIVEPSWKARHPDAVPLDRLQMNFTDVLRSCDTVVSKPGYGIIAEAACNGTPMLYVRRGDWPEESYLIPWLERRGRCLEVDRRELERGALAQGLERLLAMPQAEAVAPTGNMEAAGVLAGLLHTG